MTKRITEAWVALADENGQEQIVQFGYSPVVVPDPANLPALKEIAKIHAVRERCAVRVVKLVVAEEIERWDFSK